MKFLPVFTLETWVLFFVFLALLLLYGTWPYNHFKNLGIPGPRPLPFLGSLLEYRHMMPIINRYSEALVKNVQKRVENNESIDTKVIFGAYSMDVVASTSFSIDVDSVNNPDDPFLVNMRKLIDFSFLSPMVILIVIFLFLIPLVSKLKISLISSSMVDFLLAVVKKIKKDRQKSSHMDRVDLLQLMVDSQISGDVSDGSNTYKALSDKEILIQAVIFIFAGYETTSTALNFLSYTLATHPDVQQKVQEEIDRILPHQATPTYDAIQQMEYLDMVINENMRVYTSAVRIERVCNQTTEINGIIIPKGTVVMIPTSVLHHDPEYLPEPEEFRPERFSKENRESMDSYIFMPFGAGPKICIGKHFALLNLKVAIVSLLQKFSFRPCKETLIPMQIDSLGFLKPKKPIILKMVHRKPVACEE